MGFLEGLIIGSSVGSLASIFALALLSVNSLTDSKDYEQERHYETIDKNKVKDRNEF